MPTREEILRDQTHNDESLTVAERVHSTLIERNTAHRTSKALAALIQQLHQQGALSDAGIDQILFESVIGS